MPKPLKLMPRKHLEACYSLKKEGLYVTKIQAKILKVHGIEITHPTLSKILDYYRIYDEATGELKQRYEASLFPPWLADTNEILAEQPVKEWGYRGTMPYGRWVLLSCEKCKGRGYYWKDVYENTGNIQELVARHRVPCCVPHKPTVEENKQ